LNPNTACFWNKCTFCGINKKYKFILNQENKDRIIEALEVALKEAKGIADILINDEIIHLSENYACKECGFSVPKLEPRLFSFNSPIGACPDCKGLGIKLEVDEDLLVPNDELSINQGAIIYYKNIIGSENIEWQEYEFLCDTYQIDRNKPFKDLTKAEKQIALKGSTKPMQYQLVSRNGNVMNRYGFIEGPKTHIERMYMETTSSMMRDWYYTFMAENQCPTCH